MKRYLIEEAKCDFMENAFDGGLVVSSVKYKCDGESRWLNLDEFNGIPMFFLTDEDYFDRLFDFDISEELVRELEDNWQIFDFEGIDLDDYDCLIESMEEDEENPAIPLLRFIVALTRCNAEDVDGLIKSAAGKYADEIPLPVIDLEEDEEEEEEEGNI